MVSFTQFSLVADTGKNPTVLSPVESSSSKKSVDSGMVESQEHVVVPCTAKDTPTWQTVGTRVEQVALPSGVAVESSVGAVTSSVVVVTVSAVASRPSGTGDRPAFRGGS